MASYLSREASVEKWGEGDAEIVKAKDEAGEVDDAEEEDRDLRRAAVAVGMDSW